MELSRVVMDTEQKPNQRYEVSMTLTVEKRTTLKLDRLVIRPIREGWTLKSMVQRVPERLTIEEGYMEV